MRVAMGCWGAMGLALVASLASAQGSSAQQTAEPPRDTAAVSSSHGVHEVREGETLWGLANRYLGDPHDWTALFQANRSIIANPHWIYPHQRLTIPSGADATSEFQDGVASGAENGQPSTSAPARETPAATAATAEVAASGAAARAADGEQASPAIGSGSRGSSSRTGTDAAPARTRFYKAGAVQERARGPSPAPAPGPASHRVSAMETRAAAWLQGMDSSRRPVGRFVRVVGDRAAAVAGVPAATPHPWDRVYVTYTGAPRLAAGDTLMLVRQERRLGQWGRIMRPTALVRVLSATDTMVLGQIARQYDVVGGRDLVFLPERGTGARTTASPRAGVTGRVLGFLDEKPLPAVADLLFVSLGRGNGVRVGDELDVLQPQAAETTERPLAVLRVVRVTDRTATARVIALSEPALRAGLPVRRSLPRP